MMIWSKSFLVGTWTRRLNNIKVEISIWKYVKIICSYYNEFNSLLIPIENYLETLNVVSGSSYMKEYILNLEKEFSLIENGFKEEEKRALADYLSNDNVYTKELAFLAFKSNVYQVRMYSVFLFGHLSSYEEILIFMRDEVSKDVNWRVQEVLAKAFDEFCKQTGYEKSLPVIDDWLQNNNPNVRRAVTEGLRIWTSRPYFKDNPDEAIKRIATLKEDSSEYVRKSVGNALRDISKKIPKLIKEELDSWDIKSKEIQKVYKLASKFIKWQLSAIKLENVNYKIVTF